MPCDTNLLPRNAACFNCLDEHQKRSVLVFLYCQYAGGVAGPSNLLVSPTSTNGSNILNWTAASTQPTTYEIWRSVNGGAYAQVGSVGGAITTFTHGVAMPANDQWYYEVRACTGTSCSPFTDPAGIFENFVRTANTGVVTYDFPFLQMVFQNFDISAQLATTIVNIPRLHTVLGYFGVYNNTVLASLTTTNLKTVAGVLCQVSGNSVLTTVSLPALTTVSGGYFNVQFSAPLATLNIPILATVAGNFYCASTPALTTISAPLLTVIGGDILGDSAGATSFSMPSLTDVADITLTNCANLITVSFDSLINITGGNVNVSNSPNETTWNAPNWIMGSGNVMDWTGNALDATSVNQILARGVASATTFSQFELTGGTNSPPTGQGILDKATLIAAPNIVNTN